jgi:hypothetical protein
VKVALVTNVTHLSAKENAMGVMACDRKNCENIMCDTLIDESYICNECKEEFKQFASTGSLQPRRDLVVKFREFMQTEKVCGSNDDVSLDDFLNGN